MRVSLSFVAAAVLVTTGCDDGVSLPSSTHAALETYADIAYASYEDSRTRAEALDAALAALVANPSEVTMSAARSAWLAARDPYLQTEALRFSEGPIDDAELGVEGQLNAWPLNESHVDYVGSLAFTGLVNHPEIPLTRESLLAENENPGERDVTVGYHAIEFLLWGVDDDPNGPGRRSHADYLVGAGASAANGNRRGQYLGLVSDLLVDDLSTLVSVWDPARTDGYRADFLGSIGDRDALRRAFQGLYVFTLREIGGDRLSALLSHDQEDEHSCFSDNTKRDFVMDLLGVQNLYRGHYARVDGSTIDGTGLRDVLAEADAELASTLDARIAESLALAEAMHDPFDREIAADNAEGLARVDALRVSLATQSDLLLRAMRRLGLTPVASE